MIEVYEVVVKNKFKEISMSMRRVFARTFLWLAALAAGLGSQAAAPSYRVTVGSTFTVKASDVGLASFGKRTKVFIQAGSKIVNASTKASEGATSIDCAWKKTVRAGAYPLWVTTVPDKGAETTLKVTDYFAVVPPSIHLVSSCSAAGGESMAVSGSCFGSGVSVMIGTSLSSPLKECKLLTPRGGVMDPATGASSATFAVPNDVDSVEGMTLVVKNAVGADYETVDSELAALQAVTYAVTVGDIHETSKYLPRLKSFIKTFKQAHAGMTVTLSAGDTLTDYPRKSYEPEWARDLYLADPALHGVAMMDLNSLIPFDAVALGNHDPCLGFSRFFELLSAYPQPVMASNLFKYEDGLYTPWRELVPAHPPADYLAVRLKGLDVGLVLAGSNFQDHWTNPDKDGYKVQYSLDERTVASIQRCSLFTDMVILVTHENDLSDIISVYPPQTPSGQYLARCDIYALKDLQKVALMVGGHEHKNIFRRANYTGDNSTYNLYTNPVYNLDSKLAMVKSSKFFGEYVGVVRIVWDRSTGAVNSTTLMSGARGADGNYLGCDSSMMIPVDDGGMLQELDDATWDPTVPTNWWRMDNWPWADAAVQKRLDALKIGK